MGFEPERSFGGWTSADRGAPSIVKLTDVDTPGGASHGAFAAAAFAAAALAAAAEVAAGDDVGGEPPQPTRIVVIRTIPAPLPG